MSLPILGNQYFNQVENVASSQVQRVFTDNVVTTNLTVGAFYNLAGLVTIKGYAPTGFATLNAADLSLANVPNAAATTAANALRLPIGALVKSVSVTNGNVTVASGGTNSLATSNILNTASGSGTVITLTGALTVANINANFYTQHAAVVGADGVNVFINVTNAGGANTLGSYIAYITYFIPQ